MQQAIDIKNLIKEGERLMTICNACRYCEGFGVDAIVVVLGLVKLMSRIGCSSMPFVATPL